MKELIAGITICFFVLTMLVGSFFIGAEVGYSLAEKENSTSASAECAS